MSTPVNIACPTSASETGAFRIEWQGTDGASYRFHENGVLVYQGPENATTLTGREAGTYQYHVVEVGAHESVAGAHCTVEVAPPSLALAFGLFALGFVVFAATLALVLHGARRYPGDRGRDLARPGSAQSSATSAATDDAS